MESGEIRYPDWPRILTDVLAKGEVVVSFCPRSLLGSEQLYDVRCAVLEYPASTHVVTIFRKEAADGQRMCFRRYDNDAPARAALY